MLVYQRVTIPNAGDTVCEIRNKKKLLGMISACHMIGYWDGKHHIRLLDPHHTLLVNIQIAMENHYF